MSVPCPQGEPVTTNLHHVFPNVRNLLALEVEEVAEVIMTVLPSSWQNAARLFSVGTITSPSFPIAGGAYPDAARRDVNLLIAEGLGWLEAQSLVIPDPEQAASWRVLTRRGRELLKPGALREWRKGGILPTGLLQPALVEKVNHLFLRGDFDTAVFQAFKEVEVAARAAGKFGDEVLGRDLMLQAFRPQSGPLALPADRPKGELEADQFLFAGAIGHAKNPASHRTVGLDAKDAARLIVFASYLLEVIDERDPRKR